MFSLCLALGYLQDREHLRFEYSTEQGYDTSCGLSTLACFLDLYWAEPTDEIMLASEFFRAKMETGDLTVSFSDMKRVLESKGFKVEGYKMNFEQLEKATVQYAPIIVHYNEPESHFALVLGISDERVVTADPAEGTIERDRASFEISWSGNVMLAMKPGKKQQVERRTKAVEAAIGRRELAESELFPPALGLMRW